MRVLGTAGRHSGLVHGEVSFSTAATFGGISRNARGPRLWCWSAPGTLPSGFSALTGSDDKTSVNFGNYQYSDGSIMVFVPKFFYRIGNAASPRYATYGANVTIIVGIETYANEAGANAAGYAMHRAFYDGGAEKSGFFIDKYLASKTGTTSCKSIANADPISLTTSAGYNPSNTQTGCTGIPLTRLFWPGHAGRCSTPSRCLFVAPSLCCRSPTLKLRPERRTAPGTTLPEQQISPRAATTGRWLTTSTAA